MSDWVLVGRADEIAPGEHRVAEADETRILVFNLEGNYYAIEDVCTHDGGILSGSGVEGDQVICPRHGARFSIRTGEALTAPAYESTATFPVKVEDGAVFVRDDRWD